MAYLTLLTQTVTRFYAPNSNGVDWENYSVDTYDCRWQQHVQKYESAAGEAWNSSAIVYSTDVFQLEDWLYLGTTTETDPRELDLAYRIKLIYITQNPQDNITVYKYILC
jgi:hypothetical protein